MNEWVNKNENENETGHTDRFYINFLNFNKWKWNKTKNKKQKQAALYVHGMQAL